jgi:hypothetical protein
MLTGTTRELPKNKQISRIDAAIIVPLAAPSLIIP